MHGATDGASNELPGETEMGGKVGKRVTRSRKVCQAIKSTGELASKSIERDKGKFK